MRKQLKSKYKIINLPLKMEFSIKSIFNGMEDGLKLFLNLKMEDLSLKMKNTIIG